MPGTAKLIAPLTKLYNQSIADYILRPLRLSSTIPRYTVLPFPYPRPTLLLFSTAPALGLLADKTISAIPQHRAITLHDYKQARSHHSHSYAADQVWSGYCRKGISPIQRSSPNIHTRLSSYGGWTAIVTAGIFTAVVLFYQSYICRPKNPDEKPASLSSATKSAGKDDYSISKDWAKMTGETLPGRPGNLSLEEEEKLREFWIATLEVFGVLDAQHAKDSNGTNESSNVVNHKSEVIVSEKPKKRRIPLFGRKNKDVDSESTKSSDSTLASPAKTATDIEDKYGQTKQFHDTLAQQSPESLRATFWSMVKHDHPDALLLRFLRARKWDVEKALIMMISTMNWRATEMHVDDDIMKNGEEAALKASQGPDGAAKKLGQDFLAQLRMGKSYLHGTDKAGRPICFVRVRLHKQGEQSEESLERYTVFIIESARMVLAPPVDTACVVFDMTGFSMANMDYSPVKFMIKCFEANYPESLGVVLVHKAPWVFQGIWKIIKGWLDPVVANKVNFTNTVEDMEQFILKSHIPKDLGGEENWSYHYVEPMPNENSIMEDTRTRDRLLFERETIVKEYEESTLRWIDHNNDSETLAIKEKRHKIAADLREDYWKVDPYVRARSLYDRIGIIQKGGKLQFYQPAEAPAVQSAEPIATGIGKAETSANDVD